MALNSFAPELCSLICQNPILKRRDLNAICFISLTFRKEAQRALSYRFPCLRGASCVKSWCLSLKRTPHLALNVQDLVLFLPPQQSLYTEDVERLKKALQMCVNLEELSVFLNHPGPRRTPQIYSPAIHSFFDLPFTLTRFVNGYFDQNAYCFASFLESQKMLETLEMHSMYSYPDDHRVSLPSLRTLACPALWYCKMPTVERLRLDFEKSTDHSEMSILTCNPLIYRCKSLAIFLKQRPEGKQSHFPHIFGLFSKPRFRSVKHFEIHQFLPMLEEEYLVLSSESVLPEIETLVLRPPPCFPTKKSSDDPKLCAYVNLRTTLGRRITVQNVMKRFKTLTRFVLVDHDCDYEFRRDLKTGIIAEEELITFDKQEWARV